VLPSVHLSMACARIIQLLHIMQRALMAASLFRACGQSQNPPAETSQMPDSTERGLLTGCCRLGRRSAAARRCRSCTSTDHPMPSQVKDAADEDRADIVHAPSAAACAAA